jgi:hypothetical protein
MAICTMALIASRRFPMEAAFLVLVPKVPALLASTATFVSVAVLISIAVLCSRSPSSWPYPKNQRKIGEVARLVAMIAAVIVLVYFTTSRMMMSVVVLLTMSVAVLISVTVIKAAALLALLALMAVSKQVAQGW